ncbi:MAG: hypothetical protein HY591_06355 [Candidatus Omnitrophica bacterium]|nr:hypothetical protein [Candidatus Omnitrophota bacterium]
MKIAVFNTKTYDREFLNEANKKHGHELVFFEPHLTAETCKLAFGFEGICVFVNDQVNKAVLSTLARKVGYLGLDVYEEEGDLFFEDLSGHVIQDDVFERLLTFPNVIITGHQAFFTRHALQGIAETTMQNISDFKQNKLLPENQVTPVHWHK